jgi:2-aminoethylphosphonate-pyruvate transaminase
MTPPLILLNPGPVTLTERVRNALAREDQRHREPEFAQLVLDFRSRLSRVYAEAEADFTAILLTGSGTCAIKAMLASLLPNDEKTLIVANIVYGERMAAMARAHG